MSKKQSEQLDLGANVQRFRAKLKMTTTKLADKVGISQAQVSRLENNRQGFRSEVVVKIAEALEVPAWALYMTKDEQETAATVMEVPSLVA